VKCDCHDIYQGAKEFIPGDMPDPKGKVVSTHCFVDADHAGNRVKRRLQTGILLFVNQLLIVWYSKRQNTVETSTFVAMKIAVEFIEALQYKLLIFGIPNEGPMNIFCDNEAVTKNAIHPESTLKKKHNVIAYYQTKEAVAAGTIRVTKEYGKTNLADVLTKPLLQVAKENFFVLSLCIRRQSQGSSVLMAVLVTSWHTADVRLTIPGCRKRSQGCNTS
jgi:hypothetical protein